MTMVSLKYEAICTYNCMEITTWFFTWKNPAVYLSFRRKYKPLSKALLYTAGNGVLYQRKDHDLGSMMCSKRRKTEMNNQWACRRKYGVGYLAWNYSYLIANGVAEDAKQVWFNVFGSVSCPLAHNGAFCLVMPAFLARFIEYSLKIKERYTLHLK